MTSVLKFISKDMLRGLGIGFLVSALLVMGYPEENGKVQLLTDAEIKAKAKELGMVEKKEETPANKEVPNKTPTQPPKAKPTPKNGPITIVIPKGAYLADIADLLYQKGAIKDKKQFINLAVSLNVSSKFNVGTYSVPAGAENIDIINILIKRK